MRVCGRMRQTWLLILALMLVAGCRSDNASPMTHGADNKPSAGGATRSEAPASSNTAAQPQSPGAEGTYGESGATPGGQQTTPERK
jgi:hypothetical protein